MTAQPILQVENLGFAIGDHQILADISCGFETGAIHGLIGPNGSGKSTLLRNLCRIWEPQQGQVLIEGRDYRRLSRKTLSQMVTLVQQDTRLDFSILVSDFVAMGRHPHLKRLQWLRQRDMDIIEQALQVTGTTVFRNRPINELSGGEAQLVSLARALATEAPIILLDEPTSALDIRHKLEIMDLLTGLRDAGKTILLSIHDLDLARRYCDTVTLLQQGRIHYHGLAAKGFAKQRIKEVFHVGVEEIATEHGVSLLFYR
ncbi:ABC transporter ATP-binding protein [Syntrophotalea acetylenica]|uniref:ABC transporter ATP-binding protein n=1 Tax=Syntrophotalea acetylenica TaxID=29542 RepID=UPI002A365FB1|nr:ABC transporter ATP-binding protein [Syntrophotalea acetylenica]MDY0262363.1 ABC transporter ATP-binding protein [Syntrophotalea acetylenica]